MPEFKSNLGNKSFAGGQLQEFDVPDESEEGRNYPFPPTPRGRQFSNDPPDMDSIREFQNRMQVEQQQESTADFEKRVKQARIDKVSGRERLNEGAKRRIEMLVGMTRSSREVVLDGNTFILQSLKSKDMRDALMAATEFDGTIQSPFEIRRQLLARSLVQIAGVEASQFLGSNDVSAKLNFIDEQVEAVLNRLYSEYLLLVDESDKKYSIKTAVDAQEVVEDLKK